MKPIRVRIFRPADAKQGVVLELPAKTGDEGFAFLEEFERRYGDGERDAERDQRLRELQARIKRGEI